jgi:hypothetical protein
MDLFCVLYIDKLSGVNDIFFGTYQDDTAGHLLAAPV